MATTVFDLLARVSADVSPFNTAFDTSSESVDSALSSIYQSARRWLGAGGVAGIFYGAAASANEFSQIIADISAITDLQISKIERSLIQLDNVFGKPSHAANTFYETISSGVRGTTDEVAEYVKAVGKASTTIRADIENTGNAMTTLTNAYDLSIRDTQKLVDFLYLTVREGKAHGDELARTLGLVINNAAEAGVSLNELGAAIAILSRTQSASQSMIGLNQMLNSMIKPTLQATAEARKWNIELGAASLQAKGFTAMLQELHDKVGGNVEALEKMFGNIRAGRAVLSLTGRQFDNFITTLGEFERGVGSGEEAFTKQIDTAYKDLVRLRAQTEKTLVQIGTDVEPVTRAIYGVSEAVLKGFSDTEPLSRYATYIYIVVTALKALKKELYDIRAAIHNVAGGAVTAQAAKAGIQGDDARLLISRKPLTAEQIAARQNAMDKRAEAIRAETDYVNRGIKNSRRSVRSAYTQVLAKGDKAESAASRLLNVQMERRLAEESNSSKREQTRLRNLENRYTKQFIATHQQLDAATKKLQASRMQLAQLNQRRAALESGDIASYGKTYGRKFPIDPNSTRYRALEEIKATGSEILGSGSIVSKIGNAAFAAFAAWSVADIGYNIGKAIAERFNFSDSAFIKELVNALYDIDTDKEELENTKHNITVLKSQANIRTQRLKTAGEISEYEAENLKNEIAIANTTERLQQIMKKLTSEYGSELDRKTVRTQSLENAENSYIAAVQNAAKFQRETFKSSAITGERSRALYSAIDRASASTDISLAEKRSTIQGKYTALPVSLQKTFGSGYNLKSLEDALTFIEGGGITSQLARLKQMMGEATRSGDYTKINDILSTQNIESLRTKDIAKGLNDIQLAILFRAISGINADIEKVSSTGDDSIRTQRAKQAQEEVAKAVSNLVGVRLNYYLEDLKKYYDLDREFTGETRARYLLQNRNVNRIDDLTARLEYEADMMARHEDYLSSIIAAYDKVKDSLEEGRRAEVSKLIAEEGNKLAAAREKVQKASVAYVDSLVSDITERAQIEFEKTGLDATKVSYTLLTAKQKMQGAIVSGLQTEIDYIQKQLDSGMRGTQASVLQRQLRELKKQRDSASEKYFDALRESEEYRLQQLEKAQSAGRISGATYEAGVRQVYSERVSRANREVQEFQKQYRQNPTDEMFFKLQQATENLKDAQLDATIAMKDFGSASREVQNAMLSQIQKFASSKDAKGRLTQDALYHSLNLMTRLMGPQASFALAQQPPIETRAIPNYRNAQNAQSAVARTLDAYVRSQEYAQASTGKTVLDIYNFMKTNNLIIIKG